MTTRIRRAGGLDSGYVTCQRRGMALTNAQKQARWRERRNTLARANPDVIETTLLEEAERCEQLSADERAVLADKLVELANRYLWRSHKLAEMARKVRVPGWNPPGFPR